MEKRWKDEEKDKKINREGRKLLEYIEERRWTILHGNVRGDEEREFTYTVGKVRQL